MRIRTVFDRCDVATAHTIVCVAIYLVINIHVTYCCSAGPAVPREGTQRHRAMSKSIIAGMTIVGATGRKGRFPCKTCDPNAAIYWLARMIEGGEDVKFIARRLLILASEDIGNANPTALIIANNCLIITNTSLILAYTSLY